MTPKVLQTKLNKLYAEYEKTKEKLAKEYFNARIKPYCIEHQLSFTMMNGIPRFIDKSNNYINLPKFMQNIVDIADPEGNRIMWDLPEYIHSPEICPDKADHKFWDVRAKHLADSLDNDLERVALYVAFTI